MESLIPSSKQSSLAAISLHYSSDSDESDDTLIIEPNIASQILPATPEFIQESSETQFCVDDGTICAKIYTNSTCESETRPCTGDSLPILSDKSSSTAKNCETDDKLPSVNDHYLSAEEKEEGFLIIEEIIRLIKVPRGRNQLEIKLRDSEQNLFYDESLFRKTHPELYQIFKKGGRAGRVKSRAFCKKAKLDPAVLALVEKAKEDEAQQY